MASIRAIAERSAKAVLDINKASTALAKKFDIEISELPSVSKYEPEYGRMLQLESFADVLTQINEATEPKKEEKPKKK